MYVSPVLSVNTCRPGYEATHQVARQNCMTSPLEEGIHHLGNTIVQEIYIQKRWPHHQCKGSCDLWVTKGLATKFPRRTASHCTSGGKGGGGGFLTCHCGAKSPSYVATAMWRRKKIAIIGKRGRGRLGVQVRCGGRGSVCALIISMQTYKLLPRHWQATHKY